MPKSISVLVVDDSALMRQMLTKLLSLDPEIEVVGAAGNAQEARQLIKALNPQVVTLDVNMPGMDGLSFLNKIMTLRPMPVVMVSGLTTAASEATIQALELGAFDVVPKPSVGSGDAELIEFRDQLIGTVRAASNHKPRLQAAQESTAAEPIAKTVYEAIAVGSSTGGVTALRTLLAGLPGGLPPILITQHMPPAYTNRFADRMNDTTAIRVQEATDGQVAEPGNAYVAPGDQHLELEKRSGKLVCKLNDGAKVSGHRPSVDVLFSSVARVLDSRAIGVILTGMGRDGADGLLKMRRFGSPTFGEAESTCVVYGMPKAAKAMGAVQKEAPINKIAGHILNALTTNNVANSHHRMTAN